MWLYRATTSTSSVSSPTSSVRWATTIGAPGAATPGWSTTSAAISTSSISSPSAASISVATTPRLPPSKASTRCGTAGHPGAKATSTPWAQRRARSATGLTSAPSTPDSRPPSPPTCTLMPTTCTSWPCSCTPDRPSPLAEARRAATSTMPASPTKSIRTGRATCTSSTSTPATTISRVPTTSTGCASN